VKYVDQHNPEIVAFYEQLPSMDAGSKGTHMAGNFGSFVLF
jgi:hypothetical protein